VSYPAAKRGIDYPIHSLAAFIVGSAIPQVQTITGLIAAVAIMQFTYSFPPLLRLGYDVITDAMVADKEYVPGAGANCRVDTWRDWSRWKRVCFYLCPFRECGRGPVTEALLTRAL